jgi:hypothetical protein
MMSSSLEEQLKLLADKVDRILLLLEGRRIGHRSERKIKAKKDKPASPSAEDVSDHQDKFERLYGLWDAGEEVQVENELTAMDADELRRFADANNLNVTSKTPKQKIMQLIAGRFRERRQLMRSHFNRRSSTD